MLKTDGQDGLRVLTLDRPEVRNALNVALLEALSAELQRARDDRVRCLVLEGAGRDFGAGGDHSVSDLPPEELEASERRWEQLGGEIVRAIHAFPAPTIAILQGNVIGGSLMLALACDLRFVANDARIRIGFDRFGSTLEYNNAQVLTQLMGISNAKYFCFSRQDLSGEEALRQGLANRSFPKEELRAAALDFATDVASGPTFAFARNKALIDESLRRSLEENLAAADEALRACMASEDALEVQRAMEEGRAPVFKGR